MDVSITCVCPPKDGEVRHQDGDTVVLRDKLDFTIAVTMQETMTMLPNTASPEERLAAIDTAYLLYGIESWTLTDGKGRIPLSRETITTYLLGDIAASMDVFAVAEEMYNPVVLLPLVKRGLSSSSSTPTTGSTSAPTSSQAKPRRRPSPSSTTTTRTGGTATTSGLPDGDSKSSPSLVSVA